MAAATTNLHPDFGTPPYGFPFNVVDNTHRWYHSPFNMPVKAILARTRWVLIRASKAAATATR
jgi:hypothetical protein